MSESSPQPGSSADSSATPTTPVTRAEADLLRQVARGLPEGTIIGKYRVIRLIGEGGMGVVYEAEDVYLQRRVALKLLPESPEADERGVRRLLREAQAAARLNHPHTVTIYEVNVSEGLCYIAMELMRGGSTQARVKANGAFPWTQANRIIAQVCLGLGAAHAAGLIHRDIKPGNILLSETGDAKLADFGLVKITDLTDGSMTAPGRIVGTPHFMSPEQCRATVVDERSDIYSLGASYYTLLTGSVPFDRGSTLDVMMAHCNDAVPDPRTRLPDLPKDCSLVVRRAMAKQPEERFLSADAMRAELEAMLVGQPEVVPPAVPDAGLSRLKSATLPAAEPSLMRRFRWRQVALVTALIGIALGVTGILSGVFRGQPRPSPNHPLPTGAASEPDFAGFASPITEAGVTIPMDSRVAAVAFSPDGSMFAAANYDGRGGVRVWSFPSGKPLVSLWSGQAIRSLAFSGNGQMLVAAGDSTGGGVKIWHFTERKARYLAAGSMANAVAISPGDKLLAASLEQGNENKVRLWELPGDKELRDLPGHEKPVRSLVFSRDGSLLASGGDDGVVRVWNPVAGTRVRELPINYRINTLAIAEPSQLVAATANRLHYWNIVGWREELIWPTAPDIAEVEMTCVAFSRDGRMAFSAGSGSKNIGALYHRRLGGFWWLRSHTDAIECAAFSPDGKTLATAGRDQTVRLWDVSSFFETGKPKMPMP